MYYKIVCIWDKIIFYSWIICGFLVGYNYYIYLIIFLNDLVLNEVCIDFVVFVKKKK